MPREGLTNEIKQMIVDRLFLKVDPEGIGNSENLMDVYAVDSVRLFEIMIGLEDEFDISLEDGDFDIETFSTVNKIAERVESERG